MNEEATSLFTLEPKMPHSLLNTRILGITEVIKHYEGTLADDRTPHLYLTYGVFPVV